MRRILFICTFSLFALLQVFAYEGNDTVVKFGDYKEFLFYTRDSIARQLLAMRLNEFKDSTSSSDNNRINWETKIDYRDRETVSVLTNYCWYYEKYYLYFFKNDQLVVDYDLLLYNDFILGPTCIFPDINTLNKLTAFNIDTCLSIYKEWNDDFNEVNIFEALSKQQYHAYKNWKIDKPANLNLLLCRTIAPKKIKVPCDSSFDNRSKRIRRILEVANGVYKVIFYEADMSIVLTGNFTSIEPEIKNGEFLFYEQSRLVTSGKYVNNVPDSIWVNYNKQGEVLRKVDYSGIHDQFKSGIVHYRAVYPIEQVDSAPVFKYKNSTDFLAYICDSIFYPPYYRFSDIRAKNIVQFDISETGQIDNIKIVEGNHIDFNMEIARLLLNAPKWKPAVKNGQHVAVRMVLPFSY